MDKSVVIVTGATRGLGLSIAKLLVTNDYFVVGTGRTLSEELREAIESSKGKLVFEKLDLSQGERLHEFVMHIQKEYGFVYGLINNAAVSFDGVLATLHESQIGTQISVNVTNTIILTKYALRSMLLGRRGRIINVSSIAASTGFKGLSVYGASKAALVGFTKSLAREVGSVEITVNVIAPGYMKTQMTAGLNEDQLKSIVRRTPLGRLATADEVAKSVAFLLSTEASVITGIVLTVDAGSSA